jgi:hypothetical protein
VRLEDPEDSPCRVEPFDRADAWGKFIGMVSIVIDQDTAWSIDHPIEAAVYPTERGDTQAELLLGNPTEQANGHSRHGILHIHQERHTELHTQLTRRESLERWMVPSEEEASIFHSDIRGIEVRSLSL